MDDAQTRFAYQAMLRFLRLQSDQDAGETIADVLERMALLDDGEPADPALWQDWLESVQLATNTQTDAEAGNDPL